MEPDEWHEREWEASFVQLEDTDLRMVVVIPEDTMGIEDGDTH